MPGAQPAPARLLSSYRDGSSTAHTLGKSVHSPAISQRPPAPSVRALPASADEIHALLPTPIVETAAHSTELVGWAEVAQCVSALSEADDVWPRKSLVIKMLSPASAFDRGFFLLLSPNHISSISNYKNNLTYFFSPSNVPPKRLSTREALEGCRTLRL